MKLISENENKALRKLKSNLKEVCKKTEIYQDLCGIIRDGKKSVYRDIFQFEAAATIVIVVGMLKAGKSTLINLLSRNEKASPVGFGIDTTLRPALILMAKPDELNEGVISVYSNQGGKEDEQLQTIFDYLRGINPEAESKLTPNQHPLTSKNLNDCLCKPAGFGNACLKNEPLLVVVKLPYNDNAFMLKDGRMLLDMPGLDSANAIVSLTTEKEFGDDQIDMIKNCMAGKVDKHALAVLEEVLNRKTGVDYLFLVKECDLVLCIQSSVAPLNDKAVDYLNQILENRDEVTTFIVQNTMVNQPWLDDAVVEENGNKQLIHARKTFRNLRNHKGDLCEGEANLGMAYAAIFKQKHLKDGFSHESLEKQSKFNSLEQKLQACFIGGNSQNTRRTHCLQVLATDLYNFANALKEKVQSINEEINDTNSKKDSLTTIKTVLDRHINAVNFPLVGDLSFVSDNLSLKFHEIWKQTKRDEKFLSIFQQLIEQEEDSEKEGKRKRKKKQVPAAMVDSYAKECIDSCHREVESFLSALKIQSVRMKDKNNQYQAMDAFCNKELSNVYSAIERKLKEQVNEFKLDFPSSGPVDPETAIPFKTPVIKKFVMPESYSQSSRLKFVGFGLCWAVELPDEKKINEHIGEMIKHYESQIVHFLESELQTNPRQSLTHDYFAKIVKDKLEVIFRDLKQKISTAIDEVGKEVEKLENKKESIKDIIEAIDDEEGLPNVKRMQQCLPVVVHEDADEMEP